MTRKITLLNIEVEVPEHPRFRVFPEGVWFDGDALSYLEEDARTSGYPAFVINAKRKLESACCIAIVAWENKALEYLEQYANKKKQTGEQRGQGFAYDKNYLESRMCQHNTKPWRSVLARAGEGG